MNMDEATKKRVVSVLVCYYSENQEEVIVQHLASFSVIKVDSQTLYDEIVALFDKYQLPWENLIYPF